MLKQVFCPLFGLCLLVANPAQSQQVAPATPPGAAGDSGTASVMPAPAPGAPAANTEMAVPAPVVAQPVVTGPYPAQPPQAAQQPAVVVVPAAAPTVPPVQAQPAATPQPTYAPLANPAVADTVSSPASPAPETERLGEGLSLVLSAENLFGLQYAYLEDDASEDHSLSVSLLGQGASATFGGAQLALDLVLPVGITLGLLATVSSRSGTYTLKQGCTMQCDGEFGALTRVVAGVRGGFVVMFGDHVGFWPKAGFLVEHVDQAAVNSGFRQSSGGSATAVALSLQPSLLLSPTEHMALTLTALVNVGTSLEESGSDLAQLSLVFGLMAWL